MMARPDDFEREGARLMETNRDDREQPEPPWCGWCGGSCRCGDYEHICDGCAQLESECLCDEDDEP